MARQEIDVFTPSLETVLATTTGGFGVGLGFFTVRWLMQFIAGRTDKKEAQLDASTDRLIKGLERRLDAEAERYDRLEKDMFFVREDLEECKRKHSESEAEVLKLKAIMQGYGDARNLIQAEQAAEKFRKDQEHE